MNTLKAISFLIIFLIANKSKAQISFAASSLSTNVAKGTDIVEIRFVVKTDSLVLPNSLTYNDIAFFQIEKTDGGLNSRMTFVYNYFSLKSGKTSLFSTG